MQDNIDHTLLTDFRGLWTSVPGWKAPDNSFSTLTNFLIGDGGNLYKRPGGKRVYNPVVAGVKNAYPLLFSSLSNKEFIVSQSNGFAYKQNINNIDTESDPFTEVAMGGLRAIDACDADGYVYFNTGGGVYKFNTASIAAPVYLAGSPTNTVQLFFFKGRNWALSQASGGRLYYSGALPSSLDTWNTATQFVDFEQSASDIAVCAVPLGDRIILFKTRSVWILYLSDDPTNWSVRLLFRNVGATGAGAGTKNQTAVVYRNSTIFFIGYNGVYATDGTYVRKISNPIDDFFLLRGSALQIQPDWISIVGEYLYCSIYEGDTPKGLVPHTGQNYLFTYRIEDNQGWTRWELPFTYPTAPMEGPARYESALYIGTLDNASVFPGAPAGTGLFRFHRSLTQDTIGAANIPITARLITTPTTINRPHRLHSLVDAYVLAKGAGQQLNFAWYADGNKVIAGRSAENLRTTVKSIRPAVGRIKFRELQLEIWESSQLNLEVSGISYMTKLGAAEKDSAG